MKTLHVDLQIGFQSDAAEVAIDGDTVYRGPDVTTSPLLGIAESFETRVEEGMHQVDVMLTNRNIASSFSLSVERELYLGISMKNGEVVFRVSEDPFGYR